MDTSLQQQLKDASYTGAFDLESLVDACGDKFSSLDKHYGQIGATNHITPWWAAKSTYMDDTLVGETAVTPTIAVARLWLALNTKLK